ncbi:hypothetical protein ACQKMD_16750 [Viridibacillus sp. NPDC096237]|uniref:hypothetical protein n=1 Tax=Viridibacillus sp. NPDC096237 TaxID=3390721 RepID=UPI003D00C4EE
MKSKYSFRVNNKHKKYSFVAHQEPSYTFANVNTVNKVEKYRHYPLVADNGVFRTYSFSVGNQKSKKYSFAVDTIDIIDCYEISFNKSKTSVVIDVDTIDIIDCYEILFSKSKTSVVIDVDTIDSIDCYEILFSKSKTSVVINVEMIDIINFVNVDEKFETNLQNSYLTILKSVISVDERTLSSYVNEIVNEVIFVYSKGLVYVTPIITFTRISDEVETFVVPIHATAEQINESITHLSVYVVQEITKESKELIIPIITTFKLNKEIHDYEQEIASEVKMIARFNKIFIIENTEIIYKNAASDFVMDAIQLDTEKNSRIEEFTVTNINREILELNYLNTDEIRLESTNKNLSQIVNEVSKESTQNKLEVGINLQQVEIFDSKILAIDVIKYNRGLFDKKPIWLNTNDLDEVQSVYLQSIHDTTQANVETVREINELVESLKTSISHITFNHPLICVADENDTTITHVQLSFDASTQQLKSVNKVVQTVNLCRIQIETIESSQDINTDQIRNMLIGSLQFINTTEQIAKDITLTTRHGVFEVESNGYTATNGHDLKMIGNENLSTDNNSYQVCEIEKTDMTVGNRDYDTKNIDNEQLGIEYLNVDEIKLEAGNRNVILIMDKKLEHTAHNIFEVYTDLISIEDQLSVAVKSNVEEYKDKSFNKVVEILSVNELSEMEHVHVQLIYDAIDFNIESIRKTLVLIRTAGTFTEKITNNVSLNTIEINSDISEVQCLSDSDELQLESIDKVIETLGTEEINGVVIESAKVILTNEQITENDALNKTREVDEVAVDSYAVTKEHEINLITIDRLSLKTRLYAAHKVGEVTLKTGNNFYDVVEPANDLIETINPIEITEVPDESPEIATISTDEIKLEGMVNEIKKIDADEIKSVQMDLTYDTHNAGEVTSIHMNVGNNIYNSDEISSIKIKNQNEVFQTKENPVTSIKERMIAFDTEVKELKSTGYTKLYKAKHITNDVFISKTDVEVDNNSQSAINRISMFDTTSQNQYAYISEMTLEANVIDKQGIIKEAIFDIDEFVQDEITEQIVVLSEHINLEHIKLNTIIHVENITFESLIKNRIINTDVIGFEVIINNDVVDVAAVQLNASIAGTKIITDLIELEAFELPNKKKKKKVIWLIPARANFYSTWFTKKTR